MATLSYDDAPVPVRQDLTDSHRRAWRRIAEPGTWLDGATRVAIAAASRQAFECGLCAQRKQALSPNAVQGEHESAGTLPDVLVDIVHRVMTDPSRLSKNWFQGVMDGGLPETEYVEAVGVACTTLAVDGFARALGLPLRDLPEPADGEPTRHRPVGAKAGPAWVPWVMPEDMTEAEEGLYDHGATNVCKAMSLVPQTAIGFFDVVTAQYLPGITAIRDFGGQYRAIDRAQIELLSARISAINQCAY